ncbi:acetolactate synthase, large subunit [Pseudooceanicola batsensis HTCC2597]|uniref:Acetolactate synthase, large subunit n=1 Tax=Pseudooceanicola batsensis (strain ATCC BAA-863 / DSM 15984 / KCTC 12145 / HTCC2597) TaxID=252305 RepID=A3U0U7_PSEBH|nr:thiamine pyrophosphate-binding protein [Pseudooceanicola batsensis]EAQ02388.1 acetolactate synthase, large subunit [Pseudooceanicola batsensis HTCC2597]
MNQQFQNEMTGGEALARMLQAHNTGPIFGMGGFQLLPFYDAARRLGLNHNLINDERCGVFAADAYAKVTGRVGVVDATLGPGATNLVTGLVEALNAGSPLVAIVGDSHRAHSWKNMTQEARQAEILRPAVKELLRAESVSRIPELVRRAFTVATTGRPGPVALVIPEDVAHGTHGFSDEDLVAVGRYEAAPALRTRPDSEGLAQAADMLAAAEKPLILAGGGIHLSRAAAELQAFAEAQNIPVAHTMSGKGAVACTSPVSAGLFGRYDRIANDMIAESDCLLVIGCKLGEIATKRYTVPAPGKTVIHLDCVAEEIGRTYLPSLPLWGDAREGIRDLASALRDREVPQARQDWVDDLGRRMDAWREKARERLESEEIPVSMGRLMGELNKSLPSDAILIADGGFAAHWGGLLYDQPQAGRGFVPDRGFASIGYGLPGAIGARLGAPDRAVVALTGDGGFNMVLGELETARRMGLAVTIIVVNNAASGYVKALQHLMYGEGAYQSSDLAETNYAAAAEALGCRGIRVEKPDQLADALSQALKEPGRPTVLDVVVTRDPGKMLPAADSRAAQVKKGDRIA